MGLGDKSLFHVLTLGVIGLKFPSDESYLVGVVIFSMHVK